MLFPKKHSMALNLIPNELVGYRFRPDWYSFNVVMVKRHGQSSKLAGQEYETVLAYCKSLQFAATWLLSHVVRVQSELNQKDALAANGSVADAQALLASYAVAQEHVDRAVAQLQERVDALGLSHKKLVQALGEAPAEQT